MTAGIYCFFIMDVQEPPPALFLRNPDAYLRQLQNASAIVLFMFLRHVGIPAIQWQRAARDGEGKKNETLHAHMLHCCRCWGNKPNCALTSLIALISYYCTLPKIASLVHAFSSVSLLGRVGMAMDRLLEYINMLQQKRMNAFQGFDSAWHNTDLLQPMLHVDHAYQEAKAGRDPTQPVVTNSMIFQIREVQDFILETCGTDLTVPDPLNRFWYTGNATPLDTGDYRFKKPWVWRTRVAQGHSTGAGRAHAQSSEDYVRDQFDGHMFNI